MNPFKPIPGAFGPERIKTWHQDENGDIISVPHAYSVVERAYRGMSEQQIDQSILVSGMSGAGKTETVKICINYLSSVEGSEPRLERSINEAGLVLESFGNAFTLHNNNSSRFGKYTKMYFQHGKGMVGAELKTYLLEKTRVAHPPNNERNFHIFYQLLQGLKDGQCDTEKFGLSSDPSDYTILRCLPDSNSLLAKELEGKTESESVPLKDLLNCLSLLEFSQNDIEDMLKVLAAILHLGNVTFGEEKPQSSDAQQTASDQVADDGISFVENTDILQIAATLLGVESDALTTALTKLSLKSVQNAVLPLSKANAELARASLVSEIYERMFNWIVSKLNEVIECSLDTDECGYIAILDISGYESVVKNGFEQLTINYTNDKLNQLYNELLYREQDEYKKEFGWEPITFDSDLKDTIALIERKPEGVLPLLDEVCYRQHATDALFVAELGTFATGTSRGNRRSMHGLSPETLQFSVHHAPGPVQYYADGFLVKNRDILASSLENLLKESDNSLVVELFAHPAEKGQTSIAKFYIEQLSDLMDAIRETDYSFIKCIKPNAIHKPDFADKHYIADQIKWSGVIETLRVCSRGFPEHLTYDKFVSLFGSLHPDAANNIDTSAPKAVASGIVAHCLNEKPEAAFGSTKIYLSMSAYFKLLTLKRSQALNSEGWLARAKSAFNWLWTTS